MRRLPAYHLEHLKEHGEAVYTAVAGLLGVPPTQIALNRNSTEGLGTILLGLPLRPGDEIVCAQTDYWHMLNMLDTRAHEGVVLRMVELPVPAPNPQSIVDAFAASITERTRIVLVTHVSNVTGQIMPVRAIAEVAHRVGALVVVDASQSVAVLDHRVPDLGCEARACAGCVSVPRCTPRSTSSIAPPPPSPATGETCVAGACGVCGRRGSVGAPEASLRAWQQRRSSSSS